MKAREIMSSPAITVGPDTPVKDAARILVERRISALPVIDPAGSLIGIVSEADLVVLETSPDPRSQITERVWPSTVPGTVADVMTRPVVTLPPDADIGWVAQVMLSERVKRVPIVEDHNVVGIVSRRDVLRVLIRTDEEIEAELNAVLGEGSPAIGSIRAHVRDGVALLTVPDDERSRRLAERLAHEVPGVVAVHFD